MLGQRRIQFPGFIPCGVFGAVFSGWSAKIKVISVCPEHHTAGFWLREVNPAQPRSCIFIRCYGGRGRLVRRYRREVCWSPSPTPFHRRLPQLGKCTNCFITIRQAVKTCMHPATRAKLQSKAAIPSTFPFLLCSSFFPFLFVKLSLSLGRLCLATITSKLGSSYLEAHSLM